MSAGPDRARLFVAVELPGPITGELGSWSAAVAAARPELRRVGPGALHVTLCFLGMRPVAEVEAIGAACRAAVTGLGGVDLVLGAPVWLPRRRPRVLARVIAGAGPLQARVAGALHELGADQPEDRPFLGHVTVARVRRPFPRATPSLPDAGEPVAFTADRVTLFRSRLGDGPARYEALATAVLAG